MNDVPTPREAESSTVLEAAQALARRVLDGDRRAVSRLLRAVDDGLPVADPALRVLHPHTGRAHLVGITGTPGAGKSTLCDRLIAAWRKAGRKVGVLCIDPTSPFSGGAILGDRIRMQEHALDEGVFVRSLATRGHLGGLSRATFDSAKVLDAMGCDHVLIETVGVGQDEVEIAQLAHTTVLVTVPGMGDDVQAIKAGVLEIADVFVVNKADREGADRTVRDLRMMLELRHVTGGGDGWEPPIVTTVATRDEGVDVLAKAIDTHYAQLDATGARVRRESARARTELLHRLGGRLMARAERVLAARPGGLEGLAEAIAKREADPWQVTDETLDVLLKESSR